MLLIELNINEIQYFKKYLQTLNDKFLDRTILDNYFEKLCLKNYDDMCKSLKFNMEPSEKIGENEQFDIFNPSTKIKLSPNFVTTERSYYLKYLTYLTFFKFGKKIKFKNLNVNNFEKYFGLKISNHELMAKHFERLIDVNKYFDALQLKEIEISIDDLWTNDFETWLGIPISKNNSKEFNQFMLDIWCCVEC